MSAAGLLIVNADDWGLDEPTTDAIRACGNAGAVTSVSAMVFMRGSEHAARVAGGEALAPGLHINLTEPFTADAIDAAVRARQARLAEYFAGARWRRFGFSASLFGAIELAISDQLAEFHRLYAAEPSHIDGHEHIHQALGVLAARTLPATGRMRPSFTYAAGEKPFINRSLRALLNRLIRVRFAAPRYFFSIRDLHPDLGGHALEERLALAAGSAVEVMTHPGWADECAILLDPSWTELIGQRRLGDYGDLASSRRRLHSAARRCPR